MAVLNDEKHDNFEGIPLHEDIKLQDRSVSSTVVQIKSECVKPIRTLNILLLDE